MWLIRVRPFPLVASLLLLTAGMLAAQSTVHDQEPPHSSVPPQAQGQQSQEPEGESVETFKAQVNVVSIFFNVKDKHGLLIPALTKNDFEVL